MQCLHRNEPFQRFCTTCGAGLDRVYCGCGFANLVGNQFCGLCGASLADRGEKAPTAVVDGKVNLASIMDIEESQANPEKGTKTVNQQDIDKLFNIK